MSVCHWLASSEAMLSSNVDGVTKMSGGVGFGGQNGACNMRTRREAQDSAPRGTEEPSFTQNDTEEPIFTQNGLIKLDELVKMCNCSYFQRRKPYQMSPPYPKAVGC